MSALKSTTDLSKATVISNTKPRDINYNYRKYLYSTYKGYEKIAQSKIVVCLCCRNMGWNVDNVFTILEVLHKLFKKLSVLIYENDSTDDTKEEITEKICNNVRSDDPIDITFTTETLDFIQHKEKVHQQRFINMASVRNKNFDVVKEKYRDYDYMMVMDTDLSMISIDGIASSFGFKNWDMISANGLDSYLKYAPNERAIYYDIMSLIEEGSNRPCNRVHEAYPPHTGLIKVKSAYGGLAIYRICPELLECKYEINKFEDDKHDETDPDYNDKIYGDEHVGLCLQMAQKGLNRLYINTSMLLLRSSI